jgi:hypothetical protein
MMLPQERETRRSGCKYPSVVLGTIALFSMALLSFVMGCPGGIPEPDGQDQDGNTPSEQARDCVGCHTDATLLQAVATVEEDTSEEDAGEG